MMKLSSVAKLFGYSYKESLVIKNVTIDSRTVSSGSLFIAIKGKNFDGNNYIKEAVKNGACAVICEKLDNEIDNKNVPQFQVNNTLSALRILATYYRKLISCKIIGVTGSNGKTTVKEMISLILPKPSFASKGNLNNYIGVPISVLNLKFYHSYAVFELGASNLGEINYLSKIIKPDVSLVTNIAPAHLKGFGNIYNVAKTKGEIYKSLNLIDGVAILNREEYYNFVWREFLLNKRIIYFSHIRCSDVYARNIIMDNYGYAKFTLVLPIGCSNVKLKVPGRYSVINAIAAAACCYALGISLFEIVNGLETFRGVSGRMTFLRGKKNSLIIDDTYNANLYSVLVAINMLYKVKRRKKILVLGDLYDLGCFSKNHHKVIGYMARYYNIDLLFTLGLNSINSNIIFYNMNIEKHYMCKEKLIYDLFYYLDKDTVILVKGSRIFFMEDIVRALLIE
ncbi:UDP-N-acetylmuramoyl-tripeptide--D-alanyl-D-alanine ligase [Candidatus Legionella polyplacis]|uniref:UDP-N-acetylmuramoyl-tripeptide--D-alanyl-D-alanine ligase n=1 Tax=Candidatus Legionella polyplacis TaxID=2005262 RepID=A0ABZ2H1Q6_9GAMM